MCSDRRRRERRQGKTREIPPARSRLSAAIPSCAPPAGRSRWIGKDGPERKSRLACTSVGAAAATLVSRAWTPRASPVLRRRDCVAVPSLGKRRIARCSAEVHRRQRMDGGRGSRGPGARLRCWLAKSLWMRLLRRPGRGSLSRARISPSRRPPSGSPDLFPFDRAKEAGSRRSVGWSGAGGRPWLALNAAAISTRGWMRQRGSTGTCGPG